MADQKRIKLYSLHATPKNVIIRELPVASLTSTKIYLYPGHATAKNIVIGDPTVIRAAGDGTEALSGSATLTLTATGALLSTTALSGTASLVLTASGALVSTTSLSGAASLILAATGALVSTTALSGSASLTLTASGASESTTSLSGEASLALVATGDLTLTEGVTATGTSAGTYNMYRFPDEPKRKLRKIKYVGPANERLTFYVEKTSSNSWIPSTIYKPSVLDAIERNGLVIRKIAAAKLRRMVMADDEWLMLN